MICKHCGASLEDGRNICPACGRDQTEPEAAETAAPAEAPAAAEIPAAAETPAAAAPEAPAETPAAPAEKKKPERGAIWLLCLLVAVAVAAVVILVVALTGKDEAEPAPEAPVSSGAEANAPAPADSPDADAPAEDDGPVTPMENDPTAIEHLDEAGNYLAHTYTRAAADITEADMAAVVAACESRELTNGLLSFYYWQQFYQFMNVYGSYISMMGLDLSQPLSEQMYDETHSWEDVFLRMAMTAFWQDCAVGAAAKADGYEADASIQSYADTVEQSLTDTAEAAGFDSADAYLQSVYGPYVTAADYAAYARRSMENNDYLTRRFAEIAGTDQEISDYYDQHAEEFAAQGVEKDDTNMVSVRHILIRPAADEGAETDENGEAVLTDQNWADAEAKANDLLAQWQDGAATEETFASLSNAYNEDPGSASNGGLYENVYPGQMVPTFNDWCFDAARQPGDTGVVRTDYGFHVMYFVGQGDHPYWFDVAAEQYVSAQQQALVQAMLDAAPLTVDYDKVVLAENEGLTGQSDNAGE